MSKKVKCSEEIIIISNGEGDVGKLVGLANNGKFHPSVIPAVANGSKWLTVLLIPMQAMALQAIIILTLLLAMCFRWSVKGTESTTEFLSLSVVDPRCIY